MTTKPLPVLTHFGWVRPRGRETFAQVNGRAQQMFNGSSRAFGIDDDLARRELTDAGVTIAERTFS